MLNNILNNKEYKSDKVILKEHFHVSNERSYDGVGAVYFDIYNLDNVKVGYIDLRLKMDDYLLYYGHIGYEIFEKYRGNNYAYYSCKVLFDVAFNQYHMNELIITCNPDNIASYKTLLKLGGTCEGPIKVPNNHPLFRLGDKEKYVFYYKI